MLGLGHGLLMLKIVMNILKNPFQKAQLMWCDLRFFHYVLLPFTYIVLKIVPVLIYYKLICNLMPVMIFMVSKS